jgi:hypothetical protein
MSNSTTPSLLFVTLKGILRTAWHCMTGRRFSLPTDQLRSESLRSVTCWDRPAGQKNRGPFTTSSRGNWTNSGWLADGYSQSLTVRGQVILFRPMIKMERAATSLLLKSVPREERLSLWLRIVGERFPLSLLVDLYENDRPEFLRVWKAVHGDKKQERMDVENLRAGIALQVRYPHLASVSCEQCRHWQYNPLTGETSTIEGVPYRRIPGMDLLCETRSGCPKGHWKKPLGLSAKNKQAWAHFKVCEAVGEWPDDAIVRRNAAIILGELKRIQREAAKP